MRPHIEMSETKLDEGWSPFTGLPGLEVKVLANDLDEAAQTGARTRLVRFAPGATTSGVFHHPYWEELLVLSGDLYPLGEPQARARAPFYSIRPPGTPHGPFGSREGCVVFEVQYFVR